MLSKERKLRANVVGMGVHFKILLYIILMFILYVAHKNQNNGSISYVHYLKL